MSSIQDREDRSALHPIGIHSQAGLPSPRAVVSMVSLTGDFDAEEGSLDRQYLSRLSTTGWNRRQSHGYLRLAQRQSRTKRVRGVKRVKDYPWSTFYRFVKEDEYDSDWGGTDPCPDATGPGWE